MLTEPASTTAHEVKGWQPIAVSNNTFVGSFEGQGYDIYDLFINRPDESEVGLFGAVGEGGVIGNVGVVNGNVTGYDNAGGLVGKNEGTVGNSYANCRVTGNDNVGGLVGRNDATGSVSDSYSTGSVSGNTHVGGLMGRNAGTVSNSFWDTQTSGQGSSAGGTGKTTVEMKDVSTFSGAGWDIIAVGDADDRDTGYIWNIVDDATYPFLSWPPV